MAKPFPSNSISLFLILLLLAIPPPSVTAVSYSQLRTILSLTHSLFTRVSNLRSSRGDLTGARRARLIADKLDNGLGFRSWPTFFAMGWDYLKNYAWRDTSSFQDAFGVAYDFNELLSSLAELNGLSSNSERTIWISRNYGKVLRVSKSMFNRMLSVFSRSGPLREMVEILQREMEGDLLKDCLEVGTNDLKGLVQIFKDLVFQHVNVDRDEL